MSYTTDKNDPKLKEGQQNETGQHDIYLILSEEERAKGFVRPLRFSYIHVGRSLKAFKGIYKMLDENERKKYPKYVAIMTVLTNEDGSFKGGTYVTQEEFNAWKNEELIGGCNTVTTMSRPLAETYARDPFIE